MGRPPAVVANSLRSLWCVSSSVCIPFERGSRVSMRASSSSPLIFTAGRGIDHGSHHHPHNEKRRHGGSLNRRSSSRSRSSHRDGSRQGKSNDGRRPSSFTRSCPILASASGPVTENSSSPPPLPRGKAPHRGQLATFCEELLPLLLFSSPTPTRPSAPTLLPPQN